MVANTGRAIARIILSDKNVVKGAGGSARLGLCNCTVSNRLSSSPAVELRIACGTGIWVLFSVSATSGSCAGAGIAMRTVDCSFDDSCNTDGSKGY